MAPAFGIPMYYYDQFMRENKLYDRIKELMAGPSAGAIRCIARGR